MSFGRSVFTISSLTIISRIGGFIRDSLAANFLGAGSMADAFYVAQRLPNLFRSLFAEGAFSAAFVPLYTAEQEQHGREAAQQFAGQALMLLLAMLIPFSALIMIFMPDAMPLFAHGYAEGTEKYTLALVFSRITFPYLALISVTALQTGILNAIGRFGPGAVAPVAFNIVLIIALFISDYFHLSVGHTQAWAVTISGVVQCAWLAISCYRAGVGIPLLRPRLNDKAMALLRRIGPGAIGAGVYQVNLLISQNIATGLSSNAVSYLYYADRLNQLPLGIVGIAIATALLPLLSRHIAAGNDDKARYFSSRAIQFCLVLGLPATVGLAIAAQPIIETLFQHGKFTADDTAQTVGALQAYALGIPAFLLVKVFAAEFFARQDTKTPVKIAVIAVIVNILCSLAFLHSLQHIGIALASSIAVSVNAGLLYRQLRIQKIAVGMPTLPTHILKTILCAAIMAGVIGMGVIYGWNNMALPHISQQIIALSGLIGLGGIAYALALHFTGTMRVRDVLAVIGRKNVE